MKTMIDRSGTFPSPQVFGRIYSEAYDLLYQNKDYVGECDLLEQIFGEYGAGQVRTILDLGCGTGNHLVHLAERGYEMTGVDLSADMLAAARGKADQHDLRVDLHQGDIRSINLERKFDAVVMMFAVLGYQTENSDVAATLSLARHHLVPNGLLICDIWYGPAVLVERPSSRIKVTSGADGTILRAASSTINPRRHVCQVRYDLWHVRGDRLVAQATEEHLMRFFFPLELEYFLDNAGLDLVQLGAFPDIACEVDETTWNALIVAVAREEG